MLTTTLAALEAFPSELEKHFAVFPAEFVHWRPPSWEGVPSEPFTAIDQVCPSHDQQHLAGLQWLLGKIDASRMSV